MELALILLVLGGIGLFFQASVRRANEKLEQERRATKVAALKIKYADSPFLNDIVNGIIRPGMTVTQLVDAWGQPEGVDERVLKTKIVHTYKYGQKTTRSFRQRVKVENGVVVGWAKTD